MKHLWKYIAGALAFALPVASCSDDNTSDFPDKEWGELTAPVLTVSEEEITLDANKADREALKFSWTAASVVTRSSSVEYDLYLSIEGEDLFKGIKREWGGEADLTISFTHEELNDLIITTFGGKSGERFAFRACVYAHTDNYLIEDKTSEEVAFAATAYAAEVVKPASLWMKGGACEYGWDKAIELPQGDAGTYTAENVVLKFGKPADNKGFKFYIEENGSYPFYWQKIDGEFGQIQTFAIANDGDSQFYPLQYDYTSGIYTVHVDLNTMLLTLTRTGDVTEFDPETALYILGDNMENGWDMVEANALLLVGENIYENTNIYLKPESSFKFYFYDWTEYIRDEAAGEYWTLMKKGGDDGDIRFIPGDQGLGEGYYTVRVDLNTLKVTLTGGTAPSYPETLFLFWPATEAGWDLGNFIPLTKTSNGVFQVKGVNIDVGTANPDDNKGNGFKFGVSNSEWSTEYGAKEAFDDHDGQQGYRGWELAQSSNQFYPLLMGQASGVYDITVDFTTMVVRFEPSQDPDYPTALYILGDAMPHGWDLGQAVAMTQTAPGIFTAENVLVKVGTANPDDNKGNGFKFIISNSEWSTEYGAKEAFDDHDGQTGYRGWELAQSSNQFYPLLMGFGDGNYRITADLTTMTVRFEAM